jgi:predicted site-specific integrase-resolvase
MDWMSGESGKAVEEANRAIGAWKADLENQISLLKQFCYSNGYTVSAVYSDIASGISFEKRKEFFSLMDEVIAGRVDKVIVTYKDRLSRVGFDLFYYLFRKYNCEIIVMSEAGSRKLDSEEIVEEIVSLLHCYSMKLYSRRRLKKIREVLEDPEGAAETGTSVKESTQLNSKKARR